MSLGRSGLGPHTKLDEKKAGGLKSREKTEIFFPIKMCIYKKKIRQEA
jgi:hypothetical protein